MLGFAALSANLHQRQPISSTRPQPASKPPSTINHQTGIGPTLAKSYPIDGRGRPESPAVIRP